MQMDQFLAEGETVLCEQKRCRVKTQRAGSRTVIGSNFAHVILTNQRLLALRGRRRVVHVPLAHLRSWEAVEPLRLRSFVHYSGGPFIRIEVTRPDCIVGIQVKRHQSWIEALDQIAETRPPMVPTRSNHEPLNINGVNASTQLPLDSTTAGRRARRVGLAIAALGIIVGCLAAIAAIRLSPDVGSYPRASGERAPVELTEGEWTVFAEGGLQRPLGIEAPDGNSIQLQPTSSRQNYSYSGRSGAAVGVILAPTGGTYLVTTAPGETIAFGQGFGRRLAATIVVGVIGVLFAIAGLVTLLLTIITNRSRSE